MGMQSASFQQSPNQSGGKGMGPAAGFPAQQTQQIQETDQISNDLMTAPAVMPSRQQPMGKGGNRNITMPGQGGQPRMGMPNAYSNTIQPWDNANIKPQSQSGKGKG